MLFLLLSRRSFASGYLDSPILVASPPSLTLVRVITAVCSLLHVFTPNYDSIRWLSLPLWQYEELVFDISTQPLNLGVFSTFSFMELVFFLYSPLVFSGGVAGSIVFEAYRHFVVWFS